MIATILTPMRRADWTLLALAAAEGQSLSPVQLQKSLFLLSRECTADVGDDFYNFEPYNYGPFDSAVYSDAAALEADGLARRVFYQGRSWAEYAATEEGLAAAESVRRRAPQRAATYLTAVVAWAQRLSFDQLVRAIYAKYPDTRARSIFRG